MAHTLAQLFGNSSRRSGTLITIDLEDFENGVGGNLLTNLAGSTPAQACACWLSWLHKNTIPAKDPFGSEIVDQTNAIIAQESFSPKTFEVRNDVAQVKHEFNFAIYTTDNTAFDPDNTV